MKPWDAIIPQHEQEAYRAAGFGRSSGLGKRPALLIIDVQYRTVGTTPAPFMEAIKESRPRAARSPGMRCIRLYRREDVRSSAGYSIYEGRSLKGPVTHTIVRGRTVVRDGVLVDDAVGSGRYVSRAY
jgi:hypothetical protein